jgi:hypothetical protein
MALHPPQQKTPVLSTAAAAAANALATGQVTGTNAPASGSTDYTLLTVTATVNQTGTASGNTTAVKVNLVETAALGPTYLCDYQIGGVSKWSIRGTAPIQSATGALWDGYKASAVTQLFKGATRMTGVIAKMAIYAPTLSSDTATLTIDRPVTLYVDAVPGIGANVAFGFAAAIRVGATAHTVINPAAIYGFSSAGGLSLFAYNTGATAYNVIYMNATGLTFLDGLNLAVGVTNGTKIGTVGGASGQKLGFWNSTPIVQPVFATGASHTVDETITLLQTLGLCRQS